MLRDGVIVRQGTPAELIGESRLTEIRYRRDGELVVVETSDPTRALNELTAEALAAGRELEHLEVRRPTLEDVYLELVDEEPRMSTLLHQLRFEQKVFWRSREAAVFIFIFPLLLYALLGSVYGDEIDGVPAVDVLLAGLFGYGAANTAFAGWRSSSSSGARRACSSGCARRRSRLPSTSLPCCSRRSRRSRCSRSSLLVLGGLGVRREHAGQLARVRRRDRARRRLLRGTGARGGGAHPLGGGRVGRRERRHAPDGVPLGRVRADAGLPGRPAGDRRRAPAHVLHRHRRRRLPRRRLVLRRSESARDRARVGPRRCRRRARGASAGCPASAER